VWNAVVSLVGTTSKCSKKGGGGDLRKLPCYGGLEFYSQREYLLLLKVMPFFCIRQGKF
jgi:hypothetical protein